MKIGNYQVGQKPLRPLGLTVFDSLGRSVDLSFYDTFKVRLIGSDDEVVDLGNAELQVGGARQGKFVFVWPTDKSLFNKPGEYELQLELSGGGHRDFTNTWPIRVHQIGGI